MESIKLLTLTVDDVPEEPDPDVDPDGLLDVDAPLPFDVGLDVPVLLSPVD